MSFETHWRGDPARLIVLARRYQSNEQWSEFTVHVAHAQRTGDWSKLTDAAVARLGPPAVAEVRAWLASDELALSRQRAYLSAVADAVALTHRSRPDDVTGLHAAFASELPAGTAELFAVYADALARADAAWQALKDPEQDSSRESAA